MPLAVTFVTTKGILGYSDNEASVNAPVFQTV